MRGCVVSATRDSPSRRCLDKGGEGVVRVY